MWLPAQSWYPAAAKPAFWHVVVEDRTDVVDSVATVAVDYPDWPTQQDACWVMLSMMGKIFSRRHTEIFFSYFP